MKHLRFCAAAALLIACLPARLAAQSVTMPPSGGNMHASVSQQIGLATVTVSYNSPGVRGRQGKIWGSLVPWGTTNFIEEGFGTSTEGPWRAGANENTAITFSHDVLVQGKALKAGTYGFHLIPRESAPWTLIFSRNSTAWGSYFYDPAEDVLRVEASPKEAPFTEWLTYEFTGRSLDRATLALRWETLELPFTIEVPDMNGLYVEQMRRELQSTAGFSWRGYQEAADFCLRNKVRLEQGLAWAETAVSLPFIGERNFLTISTQAQLLSALGRSAEARTVMDEALQMGTNMELYQYGSGLAQDQPAEALRVFELTAKRFPDTWISYAGLGAGYRVTSQPEKALKYYKLALKDAPSGWKGSIEARIRTMEEAQRKP